MGWIICHLQAPYVRVFPLKKSSEYTAFQIIRTSEEAIHPLKEEWKNTGNKV
jgi:hypothetical protein